MLETSKSRRDTISGTLEFRGRTYMILAYIYPDKERKLQSMSLSMRVDYKDGRKVFRRVDQGTETFWQIWEIVGILCAYGVF